MQSAITKITARAVGITGSLPVEFFFLPAKIAKITVPATSAAAINKTILILNPFFVFF